jgi:SAM-dependent methyltransferase
MKKLPAEAVRDLRRARRHPRPTQFDYLHLRYLLDEIKEALEDVSRPVHDVLDVFCGARPYEDLIPSGARCVGLDIDDRYGVADVVSDVFLPFPDDSFDLVLCTEAFHYVADPRLGVAEIRRVLRPGGTVLITVPLVWEYNPNILEHRYTGPELAALFSEWHDVKVVENGGRAVAWATLTGHLVRAGEQRLRRTVRLAKVTRPAFAFAYLVINATGELLERADRRHSDNPYTLPMNLLLSARRPVAR